MSNFDALNNNCLVLPNNDNNARYVNDNNALRDNNNVDSWTSNTEAPLTLPLIMAIFYILVNVIFPMCFYAVCGGIIGIVAIALAPPLVLMSCISMTTWLDALPPLVGYAVADAITVVLGLSFLGTWWFVLYDAYRKCNAKIPMIVLMLTVVTVGSIMLYAKFYEY